jgi:hypothetical protein
MRRLIIAAAVAAAGCSSPGPSVAAAEGGAGGAGGASYCQELTGYQVAGGYWCLRGETIEETRTPDGCDRCYLTACTSEETAQFLEVPCADMGVGP